MRLVAQGPDEDPVVAPHPGGVDAHGEGLGHEHHRTHVGEAGEHLVLVLQLQVLIGDRALVVRVADLREPLGLQHLLALGDDGDLGLGASPAGGLAHRLAERRTGLAAALLGGLADLDAVTRRDAAAEERVAPGAGVAELPVRRLGGLVDDLRRVLRRLRALAGDLLGSRVSRVVVRRWRRVVLTVIRSVWPGPRGIVRTISPGCVPRCRQSCRKISCRPRLTEPGSKISKGSVSAVMPSSASSRHVWAWLRGAGPIQSGRSVVGSWFTQSCHHMYCSAKWAAQAAQNPTNTGWAASRRSRTYVVTWAARKSRKWVPMPAKFSAWYAVNTSGRVDAALAVELIEQVVDHGGDVPVAAAQ